MNKYELAVVLSAKLEDDERAAASGEGERLYHPFRRNCYQTWMNGVRKSLAYEIQKMKEGFYYFIHFEG